MLVSANILLRSLVCRHARVYCIRVFKKEENSRSVASCQAIEYNNDLLTDDKSTG